MIQHLNIDRRKNIPIPTQLKLEFQRILLTQYFETETELPSYQKLALTYSIPTEDLISVYEYLLKENLIIQKEDGFYTKPKNNLTLPVQDFRVLVNAIKDLGLTPSIETLEHTIVSDLPASKFTPKKQANESYLYIKRLYRGDGKVIALTEHFLPLLQWKNIENLDLGNQALVPFLHQHYDFHASTERFVHSQAMTAQDALLLDRPWGTPILKAYNIIYNAYGEMIEYTLSQSLGDLIEFTQKLSHSKENA